MSFYPLYHISFICNRIYSLDISFDWSYNNTTFANRTTFFRACTGFDGGFEVKEAIRGADRVSTAT